MVSTSIFLPSTADRRPCIPFLLACTEHHWNCARSRALSRDSNAHSRRSVPQADVAKLFKCYGRVLRVFLLNGAFSRAAFVIFGDLREAARAVADAQCQPVVPGSAQALTVRRVLRCYAP